MGAFCGLQFLSGEAILTQILHRLFLSGKPAQMWAPHGPAVLSETSTYALVWLSALSRPLPWATGWSGCGHLEAVLQLCCLGQSEPGVACVARSQPLLTERTFLPCRPPIAETLASTPSTPCGFVNNAGHVETRR